MATQEFLLGNIRGAVIYAVTADVTAVPAAWKVGDMFFVDSAPRTVVGATYSPYGLVRIDAISATSVSTTVLGSFRGATGAAIHSVTANVTAVPAAWKVGDMFLVDSVARTVMGTSRAAYTLFRIDSITSTAVGATSMGSFRGGKGDPGDTGPGMDMQLYAVGSTILAILSSGCPRENHHPETIEFTKVGAKLRVATPLVGSGCARVYICTHPQNPLFTLFGAAVTTVAPIPGEWEIQSIIPQNFLRNPMSSGNITSAVPTQGDLILLRRVA